MSRKFSRQFYKSKLWQQTRDYILKRDSYICRSCGQPAQEIHHKIKLMPDNINDPMISLHESNLISLCRNCHFKEHEPDRGVGIDTADGYMFDDMGNVVKA